MLEKRISDIVKSTDRNIDNVYVSVNPDFYPRTTSYRMILEMDVPLQVF